MRPIFTLATLAALALGTVLSLAPASAGTYKDNVFRPGEPRWGSSSRHYEDRNRHYRHGNVGRQRGYNHAGTVNRSRGRTITASSFTNVHIKHTTGFEVVAKTGVGRSVPPTDPGCFKLSNGNLRCPNR